MGICHQSIFVRTSLAVVVKFDLKFRIAADFYMIKTLYNMGYGFYYVNIVTSVIDSNGFSAQNRREQLKEMGLICGIDKSIYFFLYSLYYSMILFTKSSIKRLINCICPNMGVKLNYMKKKKKRISNECRY
jgi:hypothetical protein